MMKRCLALIVGSGLVFVALGQTLMLRADVLDGGGKKLLSADYAGGLSIGQSIASGLVTSSDYRAILGFWNRPFQLIGLDEGKLLPAFERFWFAGCKPNPFQNQTTISYALGSGTNVNFRVFSNSGRIVGTLVNGYQKPGVYRIAWNVAGVSQKRLPNGVYFLRLEADGFQAVQKAVIAR